MIKRIFYLNVFIFSFYSISHSQLLSNLNSIEFKSSKLVIGTFSSNKNIFIDSSCQYSDDFIQLRYNSFIIDSSLVSTNYNTSGYRSFKIAKQIVFSQISGVIFAFGVAVIGSQIAPNLGWGGLYLMYGGYLVGMILGVHKFGNDKYERAPFTSSLLGGLLGLPIGILVYNSDRKQRGFTGVAPFALPTIGAVISFNLSAKPR
jgi:hypothetical protein